MDFHALNISYHENSICGLDDIRIYNPITGDIYINIHISV